MEQEKSFNVFIFLQNAFFSFGIMVLFVTLIAFAVHPEEHPSGMLRLAHEGLSTTVLLQFFITSLCCSLCASVFGSGLIFKKRSQLWRSVFTTAGYFIITSVMVILFDWFPDNDQWVSWLSFVITFALFTTGGILIMILKTRYESKKYEKILHDFKERKAESKDEQNQS